jgi:hypothetical protein
MAMIAACRRTVLTLSRVAKELVVKVRNNSQRMKMTTNPCSPRMLIHRRELRIPPGAAWAFRILPSL